MTVAMLNDVYRCIGCNGCRVACKGWNDLPAEAPLAQNVAQEEPQLSANVWTIIQHQEFEKNGRPVSSYIKRQCMHCDDPACAAACIVGALEKRPEGPVIYDPLVCIGCRYCQMACPFGVPSFEWDKTIPLISKCEFCIDRLDQGNEPSCVLACPAGAIIFGDREELLTEARRRIQANPEKYVNHIYGEKEAGGTSVLYVSHVPYKQLGLPDVGSEPIPRYSDMAMSAVFPAFGGMAALMGGFYWFTQRKDRLMKEASSKDKSHE